MDKKGDKRSTVRPSRQRKRKFQGNRYSVEQETSFASTSAQKLRQTKDKDIKIEHSHGYRILQFAAVFSAITELVVCKNCQKDVKFNEASSRGLGFKIAVSCDCGVVYINSCPLIKNAYEINRRIVFVMRLLGIGKEGLNLFCGLMDLTTEMFSNTYYACLNNVYIASQAVYELVTKSAIKEEKEKTLQSENSDQHLTVSGDGFWKKRGFSSLFGVTTLVGKYTNKIIDLIVKSSYCKMCETWEKKIYDKEEYEEWLTNHEKDCAINHKGSAGKMEVDVVKEMFERSITKYDVKYTRYVGDGDSKTFKGILDLNPYDVQVKKLECVLHVKKRMGSRLRSEKKKHKGIGGKGAEKLTDIDDKLINDLTAYYGLAITRHSNSLQDMKNAVWATFYHKCSTDKNPQHKYCPTGSTSSCSWRRAEAEGTLNDYTHDAPLTDKVQEIIKPIYENLSNDELLERCLGGNTQNNNESFNGLLWHFAPKHLYCGVKTIKIAAYLATIIFNEGYNSILKTFEIMGITIGPVTRSFAEKRDNYRIKIAEKRHTEASKEARIVRRNLNIAENEFYEEEEGVLYGPGIAD